MDLNMAQGWQMNRIWVGCPNLVQRLPGRSKMLLMMKMNPL